MLYWNDTPPTHVTLARLMRALSGSEDTAPVAPNGAARYATPDDATAFVNAFKRGHGP